MQVPPCLKRGAPIAHEVGRALVLHIVLLSAQEPVPQHPSPTCQCLAMISMTESWQWLIKGGSCVSRTFGGALFYSRHIAEEHLDHVAPRRTSVQLAPTLVASSTAAARPTHCAGFSGRGLISVMGQMCLAQSNEITLFSCMCLRPRSARKSYSLLWF